MKRFSLSLVILTLAVGQYSHAGRSLAVGAARTLAKTAAGQRYLSRMTGKSLEQIGQMGLSARASMLTEVSSGNEELVFQLTRASEKISIANNPEASAEKLLLALRPNTKAQKPTLVQDIPEGREALDKVLSSTMGGLGERPIRKGGDQEEVKLTHDIEVVSTPVTQTQVLRFEKLNREIEDSRGSGMEFANKLSEGNGKVPVSENEFLQITQRQWERFMGNEPFKGDERRIMEFANRLSEERGLRPVYDLSIEGEVRINAPGGDIYQAEGFRLPTEADLAISELVESIVPEFKWLIHDGIVDSNSPFLFKLVRGNL
ncbi:MAG: hypothetical protein OXB88_03830 [Bacteriovoracales bacterium]|nr:hypothetical protein [Bacteriovoracales bacterium]